MFKDFLIKIHGECVSEFGVSASLILFFSVVSRLVLIVLRYLQFLFTFFYGFDSLWSSLCNLISRGHGTVYEIERNWYLVAGNVKKGEFSKRHFKVVEVSITAILLVVNLKYCLLPSAYR